MTGIGGGWEVLKAVGVILWPVRFLILIQLVLVGIFFLSQGQDALYGAIVEGKSRSYVLAAVILWAVQSWYWARFLLHLPLRRLPARLHGDPPFGPRFTEPWIAWVPRALGAAVFLIVALFVLVASANSPCPDDQGWSNGSGFWLWRCRSGPIWAALCLLGGLAFVLLTMLRRSLLELRRAAPLAIPGASAATYRAAAGFASVWIVLLCVGAASAIWEFPPVVRQIAGIAIVFVLFGASLWTLARLRLPRGTTIFVGLLVVLNSGLFLVTIFYSAHAGLYLGPAVALVLNAGLWAGATSFFLVMPGERLRLPVTTLFVLGMAVFSAVPALIRLHSGEFDNHRVRPLPGAAAALGDKDGRVTLREAFGMWHKQAPCLDPSCARRPMILVAAEGGASRSGYWVAMILGALEDVFRDSGRDFHKSVFAISSVSGGSLGAAVYQRLVAHGLDGSRQPCAASDKYSVCGQRVIEKDFLGAVFFSAFGPDLLQRLFPGDLLPDRATALEQAWELAWRDAVGSDDFAAPFQRMPLNDWIPALFLNGASVKTGRRIITSDVAVQPQCASSDLLPVGPDLPSAVDFFCLTRQPIRWSTAVHNSARFPYISPAGALWAQDSDGGSWKADEIDDGGYFEAEGSTTLFDIVAALRQPCDEARCKDRWQAWSEEIAPILITIQNDPIDRKKDCNEAARDDRSCRLSLEIGDEARAMSGAMRLANDLLAPPIGLASSRTGRGAYAARALEVEFYGNGWPALRFNLHGAADPDRDVAPAMSWYLSKRSLHDMAADLCQPAETGRPEREIDISFRQLGKALHQQDLLEEIRHNPGCPEIQAKIRSSAVR